MAWFFAFFVAAASTAINVAFYVSTHSPVSLAAAIFCGFLAAFNLAMAAAS